MNLQRIAIVDVAWGGHVPMYHGFIARELVGLGLQVTSFSPRPVQVAEWCARHLGPQAEAVRCLGFGRQASASSAPGVVGNASNLRSSLRTMVARLPRVDDAVRTATALRHWRHLGQAVDALPASRRPEAVFLPYLEGGFLGPHLRPAWADGLCRLPWSGIFFHPTHLRRPGGDRRVERSTRLFRARQCRAIVVLDEGVAQRLSASVEKPVSCFPDFTELELNPDASLAVEARRRAQGRPIITLIGALSRKKNVGAFLRLSERMDPARSFFLVAGELLERSMDVETARTLVALQARPRDNLMVSLGPIADDATYNALVATSNVIFAVYADFFHSSNSLTKAAAFEKPVLVADGHLMAERVRRFALGDVVPVADSSRWPSALEALVREGSAPSQEAVLGRRTFAALHSRERLRHALEPVIEGLGH